MKPADLDYANLVKIIKPYTKKERSESASFFNWFLEQIYRLDEVAADDAICDENNDKGIDGILVDEINEEIHLFQAKIRKTSGSTIGDVSLKTFMGSVEQFTSPDKIDAILSGNANKELKDIITKRNIKEKLKDGYTVVGVFIANQDKDANTLEYLKITPSLRIYDRSQIADSFVELDDEGGIQGSFLFSADQAPLHFPVSDIANVYIFPASAVDLVKLDGISDGSLFSRNVRLSLGTTKVNKDIVTSITNPKEHIKFPLYHNGITLICASAKFDKAKGQIAITDYSVVNGAQSLSSLYLHRASVTKDLNIILKVIELKANPELANLITINSNNQNAIKARDLRSNHAIQQRLKAEFSKLGFGNYDIEIKRGEVIKGKEVITNEDAGRMLLAFDLQDPSSCHQIYKIFDELYSEVFGRKEVTATRIAFLFENMKLIEGEINGIENKALAHYGLTKYFLLAVISAILRRDDEGAKIFSDPSLVVKDKAKFESYKTAIKSVLSGLVIDLNFEIKDVTEKGELFDYKEILKSPVKVKELSDALLRSFQKDVARDKAKPFSHLWANGSDKTKKAKA